MEVGQGPDVGCIANGKKKWVPVAAAVFLLLVPIPM
jgi:hypothetical protein